MENVIDVAQVIFNEYKQISGETIDEMKLHKLLYFTQRESIAITGENMFDCEFEGWKYGPVCRTIRSNYTPDGMAVKCNDISLNNAYIVKNVLEEYGFIESWKLSQLTHKEISWKNARLGLQDHENGNISLRLSDIRLDAQKVRPYDHIWDMYYDEFETVAEGMN